MIRGTKDVIPEDPRGQELVDPSSATPAGAVVPALGTDGDATDPASAAGPRDSPTDSAAGAPTASAASGSQNTVTTPSNVSKINVDVTTVEVRSALAGAGDGLPFFDPAIGRSIST